ncbi:polyribonucleotide nucleotidyltransferase [Helicobacter sp. MIT 05-5294]|uniref:polyribonucleotide nucleotidyltransferase n=1 Tax=Helicobacter sp. MIT 05-5294 TaxID=1548150 RepID=UPI0010FD7E29|nr:polyribonucleotide nucleotidyltransferase [Helicobacter sp. MIT 05-5294]TLD89278.1 polyribonucleotide nucleotidyltransferase [Helicobacter sp. MIT 05-5294]
MGEARIMFLDKEEKYIFDKFAKQASGSVYYQSGNNVLLATVAIDEDCIVEEDFLPLTVQYIEKAYAAGKFPGGYVKREAKPSDFETLTARIIDRSLRPLFSKNYCYPTQITILVLSADNDADLQILALNAASAALYVSEIPLKFPVNGVRIGRIGEEFVVNPSLKEQEQSTLDLLVSGVNEDLLMIEMRTFGGIKVKPSSNPLSLMTTLNEESITSFSANELEENQLIEALEIARTHISKKSQSIVQSFEAFVKPALELGEGRKSFVCEGIESFICQQYLESLRKIIESLSKTERHSQLKAFAKKIAQDWKAQNPNDIESLEQRVEETLDKVKRNLIRQMILEEGKRADGRGLKEVRPISIETNLLPKAHSSALFTRGQTQALVVCTLGGDMDAQNYELLTEKTTSKERFMVHYNFPPFSVGEASSIGATGRRELGHGNLAKRALECSLIYRDSKTIRLVSEILESNGSSSMASVCGGSLALAAADIECTSLIAGVAMGLVCEGEKYAILTDIMGLEDHDGDMDFKVAGSAEGITALQMDIKLGGLKTEILKNALFQAKEARLHILGLMEEAKRKIVLNTESLPSSQIFAIHPSKIVEVIGQAGKTIKEIIEKFEVVIDLNRDNGEVKVSGGNKEKVDAAKEHIINIANSKESKPNIYELYQVGDIYTGRVKKIVEFGAFVELPHHYDGLLHISKVTHNRNEKISDYLKEGDEVRVEVLSLNKNKVELGLLD